MQILWDFIRRTFYMSVFIIPIPIGAYTIHNGSSAISALVAYVVLSVFIPFFYLRSSKSGFGLRKNVYVHPLHYWVGYIVVQLIAFLVFAQFELDFLWNLPTLGRDIFFIVIMYTQVFASLLVGYVISKAVYGR